MLLVQHSTGELRKHNLPSPGTEEAVSKKCSCPNPHVGEYKRKWYKKGEYLYWIDSFCIIHSGMDIN